MAKDQDPFFKPPPIDDLLNQIDQSMHQSEVKKNPTNDKTEPKSSISLTPDFTLLVNKNRTKAWLHYKPTHPKDLPNISASALLNKIREKKLTFGIINKNIQKAFALIREDPSVAIELVIATGKLPIPPKSASVSYWLGNEKKHDEEGILVQKNELIMKLSPAIEGIDGTTVFNESISPPKIEPKTITAGEYVRVNNQGEYYAETDGIVRLENNILSVIEKSKDATFSFTLSQDKTELFLSLSPSTGSGEPITLETIQEALNEKEVTTGILLNEIKNALKELRETQKPVNNVLIALGKKPMIGLPEKIEWHVNPSPNIHQYVIDEQGNVNFHQINQRVSIPQDTLIITRTPPTKGEDGMDIFGQTLEGIWGPKQSIKTGENIYKKNDSHDWYAKIDGMLIYKDDFADIRPVYYVDGDVDFSTGDIKFNGDIIVAGNILEGFSVTATGNITVQGTIEAANVEAGKNIYVQKGIFGKEKGVVKADENIVATFLQNAWAEAGHSLIIGNQILNSHVKARYRIEAKSGKGNIVGGEIVAGSEITAKLIGTEFGTKTLLEIGLDFISDDESYEKSKRIKELQAQLAQLEHYLQPGPNYDMLPEETKIKVKDKHTMILGMIESLKSEKKELDIKKYLKSALSVRGLVGIMPEVTIKMHDKRYKFKTPIQPCIVVYDHDNAEIKVSGPKTTE